MESSDEKRKLDLKFLKIYIVCSIIYNCYILECLYSLILLTWLH